MKVSCSGSGGYVCYSLNPEFLNYSILLFRPRIFYFSVYRIYISNFRRLIKTALTLFRSLYDWILIC